MSCFTSSLPVERPSCPRWAALRRELFHPTKTVGNSGVCESCPSRKKPKQRERLGRNKVNSLFGFEWRLVWILPHISRIFKCVLLSSRGHTSALATRSTEWHCCAASFENCSPFWLQFDWSFAIGLTQIDLPIQISCRYYNNKRCILSLGKNVKSLLIFVKVFICR